MRGVARLLQRSLVSAALLPFLWGGHRSCDAPLTPGAPRCPYKRLRRSSTLRGSETAVGRQASCRTPPPVRHRLLKYAVQEGFARPGPRPRDGRSVCDPSSCRRQHRSAANEPLTPAPQGRRNVDAVLSLASSYGSVDFTLRALVNILRGLRRVTESVPVPRTRAMPASATRAPMLAPVVGSSLLVLVDGSWVSVGAPDLCWSWGERLVLTDVLGW